MTIMNVIWSYLHEDDLTICSNSQLKRGEGDVIEKITVTKGYDGIRKIEIIRSNAQVFYYWKWKHFRVRISQ